MGVDAKGGLHEAINPRQISVGSYYTKWLAFDIAYIEPGIKVEHYPRLAHQNPSVLIAKHQIVQQHHIPNTMNTPCDDVNTPATGPATLPPNTPATSGDEDIVSVSGDETKDGTCILGKWKVDTITIDIVFLY